jgi:hypothetical protein
MLSDLISYGVLAGVFIVTGLRMLVEKPNKIKEIPLSRWKRLSVDKNSSAASRDV